MKNTVKFLVGLIMMMMPCILLAQGGTYIINGKVGQLSALAKAYLIYRNAQGVQVIDSTLISKGGFNFTGVIANPEGAFLTINKRGTGVHVGDISFIEFYLEPATITFTGHDSLDNAQISGGQVNADNERLKIALSDVTRDKMAALDKMYQAASAEERKTTAFGNAIGKISNSIQDDKKPVYLAFIKANPNSLISLFALESYAGPVPDVTEIRIIFNSLSAGVRASNLGIAYGATIAEMKDTSIGTVAPDFTMPDTADKAISLHNFKGKYVLIDFWASWCGPCRAENPNVVKAYALYKNKNFVILGVSLDEPGKKDKWLKAIHEDQLTWPQVSDLQGRKNKAAQLYGIMSIPQNFLVGPDGKIVAKNLRGDKLVNKLKELFD